ncbi:MAG TPA: hypothetical protein VIJ25_03680, partial [Methylococcales bacterium]
ISSTDSALAVPQAQPQAAATPLNDKKVIDSAFTLDEKPVDKKPIEQKCLLNSVGQAIFDQEENLELMTITIKGLTQPIVNREQVIPSDHMSFMSDSIKYFTNSLSLEVLDVEYLPVAREIHLKTKNNVVIWLSIDHDYKEQIDKLNTIYKTAELDKDDIAYIDLRVNNKVIYCPRHARCDK